jgi:hypothetical protein
MKKEAINHPEFAEILDLLEGKLPSGLKNKVESHLESGCSGCAESMQWARLTTSLMKSADLIDAPEFMVQKALRAFPRKRRSLQEWIHARLEFDSSLVPALQGVRSEDAGPRQWTYATRSHKVFLMLQPGSKGSMLTGQVVAGSSKSDNVSCLVELIRGKKVVASGSTNENGEFMLSPVPAKCDLRIHGDRESILIPLHR